MPSGKIRHRPPCPVANDLGNRFLEGGAQIVDIPLVERCQFLGEGSDCGLQAREREVERVLAFQRMGQPESQRIAVPCRRLYSRSARETQRKQFRRLVKGFPQGVVNGACHAAIVAKSGNFQDLRMTTRNQQQQIGIVDMVGKPRSQGVAFQMIAKGYGGDIRLLLGVDADGRLLGVRVLSHAETPGLGDKIETAKSGWALGFDGLSLGNPPVDRWKVKKDGGRFDQFSGATITPRAVVAAVRRGLEFFARQKAVILAPVTGKGPS